jgi:UDP-N-acetylmuramyl pentapeptide phosphotransferase/UDP-N-acetylglucosamine-1-phosphate transferase
VYVLIIALAVLLVTPAITTCLLRRTGSLRLNFRGEHIPAIFGLSIVVSSLVLFALSIGNSLRARETVLQWVSLVLSFGALGFIDDRWGDKQIKGLKGHLRAALKDHRITSGLIKAIGGIVIGLAIGNGIYAGHPLRIVAAGLLIALCANGMNLLDLRPGRACAVFLLCASALLAAALYTRTSLVSELLLVCVMLPTLPAWILDSRAKVMLGDTGSNVLGAGLGLAVVYSQSTILEVITLAVLIALHIVAERRSITQIIANNKILNTLDRLTGVRE